MMVFQKAQEPWNKGIQHSEETKRKISLTRKDRFSKGLINQSCENNGNWKGENVGYFGLHKWIQRHKLKPKFCENCKENPPYDLANISGEYKRDINDFEWLCRRCHFNKDGRKINLIDWTGKTPSEEIRNKISESMKLVWKERKEMEMTV